MICFGRYAIAFLAVLTLSFSPTLAEEPEPVVPEPKATSPTTISIEDVAQQAVTVAAELEALVPSEGAQAEVQQIRDEINDLLTRVDVRLSIIQPAMAGAPKARSMDEWGKDLRRLLESLQALDQQLAGRLNQLSAALEQVTTTETQWEASRNGTVYAEASDAVRSRIDTTLSDIGLVSLALTGPREEILSLRDRLVEPIGVVSRTLRELDARVKNRLDGILEPDRPRLWDEAVSQAVGKELREGGGDSVKARMGRFTDYVGENLNLIAFQAALFVALAFGLRVLGSRAVELAEEEYDLRRASQIFAAPIAMALVITLSLTSLVHPRAPQVFILFAYSVVVIPAAMIVGRLLSPINRPIVWGLLPKVHRRWSRVHTGSLDQRIS